MNVSVKWDKGLLFKAENATGGMVEMGRPADYPQAVSPMEMVLQAAGGCSSIDILMILEKQRVQVRSYRVEVRGERQEEGQAKPFREISLYYFLDAEGADVAKVRRAVELSVEKYCSVIKMLEQAVAIRYEITLNGSKIERE